MEDGLEELSCPAKEDAMEIPVSVRAAKLSDYAQLHPELELYGLSLGMRDGNEDWKKHTLTKQTHLMIESLSRWRGRQEWGRRFPGGGIYGTEVVVQVHRAQLSACIRVLAFRVAGDYWPNADIAGKWYRVTRGMGGLCRGAPIEPEGTEAATRLLLSGPCRLDPGGPWGPWLVRQALDFRNKRTVGTFGDFRRRKDEEDDYGQMEENS